MQLQDALQAFLLQLEADGRSPHTIGQYRRHCTALATWLSAIGASTDVADLTPDALARFFADDAARTSCRGGAKKAVSLNAMRTSIRCLCGHLHDAGLVAANPARLLRRARCAPPPPRALHPDEQKRLLDVLAAATGREAERDRMLVALLLGTGIRIGSALAIVVEDLDFDHGEITLRQTKNDRPATVVMPKALAGRLRRFVGKRTSGPLFLAGDRRVSMRHAQLWRDNTPLAAGAALFVLAARIAGIAFLVYLGYRTQWYYAVALFVGSMLFMAVVNTVLRRFYGPVLPGLLAFPVVPVVGVWMWFTV